MKNNNIVLLVGASGSGKTAIANELYRKYGLDQIKSYTTRAKRSPNEDCHTFISDDEFDMLEDIVAYTDYNGHRYCATSEQVDNHEVYVIDPAGVDFFFENYVGYKTPIVVYIDTPEHDRFQRLVETRTYDEATERITLDAVAFKDADKMADFIVENGNDDNFDEVVEEIYKIWRIGCNE